MRRRTRSIASEAAASESAEQSQPLPDSVVVAEFSAEELGGRSRATESAQNRSERGQNQQLPRNQRVASESDAIWEHEEIDIATTAVSQVDCPVCQRDSGMCLTFMDAKELEAHCKEHLTLTVICKCNVWDNGKPYKTANGLRIHAFHCKGEVIPVPDLPFRCDECGSSFTTKVGSRITHDKHILLCATPSVQSKQ